MAPLSRKIRWIFISQALAASLLVTLGTLLAASWLSNSILGARISQEANNAWETIEQGTGRGLPQSMAFRTIHLPPGGDASEVPPELLALPPGVHTMQGPYRMAYVGERPAGRLYMVMTAGATDRIVRGVSLLAIALSLIAIILVSWLGYQRCKRVVAPVSALAAEVQGWDPRTSESAGFHADTADGDRSNEVESLRSALNDMAGRVGEHIRRESNFTRDASHEFRTPLTVMRMASDLLEHEPEMSRSGERSVRRIRAAAREMEEVLDALLILARDPQVPVESVDVPVVEIVEEQLELARLRLRDKPVDAALEIEQVPHVQAPLRVLGVMLSQLLRNACDFTEAGRVAVQLKADRIVVVDTGIGMDDDTLQRVFEPFYRADISNTSAKGMGLPVVQRLAERFGWDLQIDSAPGVGTRAAIVFAGDGQPPDADRRPVG